MVKERFTEGGKAQLETLTVTEKVINDRSGGVIFTLGNQQHNQLGSLNKKVFNLLRQMALLRAVDGLTLEQIKGLTLEQISELPGIEPPTLSELDSMEEDDELVFRLSISNEDFNYVMKMVNDAIENLFNFKFYTYE